MREKGRSGLSFFGMLLGMSRYVKFEIIIGNNLNGSQLGCCACSTKKNEHSILLSFEIIS